MFLNLQLVTSYKTINFTSNKHRYNEILNITSKPVQLKLTGSPFWRKTSLTFSGIKGQGFAAFIPAFDIDCTEGFLQFTSEIQSTKRKIQSEKICGNHALKNASFVEVESEFLTITLNKNGRIMNAGTNFLIILTPIWPKCSSSNSTAKDSSDLLYNCSDYCISKQLLCDGYVNCVQTRSDEDKCLAANNGNDIGVKKTQKFV